MHKLNALAARAMGWHRAGHALSGPYWEGKDVLIEIAEWNPAIRFDDSCRMLETILKGRSYEMRSNGGAWDCITNPINEFDFEYPKALIFDTAPLAMTVCALRAAGIPESEITAAMKE